MGHLRSASLSDWMYVKEIEAELELMKLKLKIGCKSTIVSLPDNLRSWYIRHVLTVMTYGLRIHCMPITIISSFRTAHVALPRSLEAY